MTFGIIILPCNAAAVFVLIALVSTASGLFEGLGAFLLFGLGITLPLLIITGLTQSASRQLMGHLTHHHRGIQVTGGVVRWHPRSGTSLCSFFPESSSSWIGIVPGSSWETASGFFKD